MQRTKLKVFLALAITILVFGIAHGGKLHHKKGFSITIPDGWIEIPRKVIDTFENEISRQAPNAQRQHYDYGFQLESSNNWFEYPYILIQVMDIGRIPESQLEKLEKYPIKDTVDKSKKDLSSLMSDVQVGKMYHDKQGRIIWMRIESKVVNIGMVSGLSGMMPTEKGFIQIAGYSLKNDFSNYEQIFRSVCMSVLPEPDLVYKPKWGSSSNGTKMYAKYTVMNNINGLHFVSLNGGLMRLLLCCFKAAIFHDFLVSFSHLKIQCLKN